jgi:hypothetical protein
MRLRAIQQQRRTELRCQLRQLRGEMFDGVNGRAADAEALGTVLHLRAQLVRCTHHSVYNER